MLTNSRTWRLRGAPFMKLLYLTASLLAAILLTSACRRQGGVFVIALSDPIRTIDPIGAASTEAAPERVRVLIFNSLVKKDEKFDYVPELASKIDRSEDGLSFTFALRDGVTFHDGRPFTSADAKYTIDILLASDFGKSASFFAPSTNAAAKSAKGPSYVSSVEASDPHTLIIRLTAEWTGLLSNLVAIPMIPKDSYESQKTHPLGTGPFKFKSYDSSQQVVEVEANPNYWDGPPGIPALRVRVISDMNALQAELRAGRVDMAPLPTSLSPDAVNSFKQDQNLQVLQFPGSNLNLLTFNVSAPPLNDARVRRAICYTIDRETMISKLLLGQGKIAHSILPEESWAFTEGTTYHYDPAEAKKLLDEAGFHDPDGDGPQMRFSKPLVFRIIGSSTSAREYAGVIQNYLKEVGVPITIEAVESTTHFTEIRRGNFEIAYGQWVGGNQDPIFYKDLFATSEIPTETRASKNRSRYSNVALDPLLEEAVKTWDRQKAVSLYTNIQQVVINDAPVFPLWYQANMVIAKKSVGNIHVNASGDWGFVKDLTIVK